MRCSRDRRAADSARGRLCAVARGPRAALRGGVPAPPRRARRPRAGPPARASASHPAARRTGGDVMPSAEATPRQQPSCGAPGPRQRSATAGTLGDARNRLRRVRCVRARGRDRSPGRPRAHRRGARGRRRRLSRRLPPLCSVQDPHDLGGRCPGRGVARPPYRPRGAASSAIGGVVCGVCGKARGL